MTDADASRSDGARLERAFEVYLAWLDAGGNDPAGFLAAHADLQDILEPMVAGSDDTAAATPAPETAAVPVDPGDVRGRVLGDFRLVREIGRGGMGVVYEARQISLSRQVALKVLPEHLTRSATSVARFRREAETAARLHHPGIVAVHAVGSIGDLHYFAMDLVDGLPLDAVVRQLGDLPPESLDGSRVRALVDARPFPAAATRGGSTTQLAAEAEASTATAATSDGARATRWQASHVATVVELVAQVAEALEHAHRAGVIHRDVKPSNILVRPDGRIVLTDFGLSRETGLPSLSMTGDFAGTPYYVSPEQARAGDVPVDHRTDLFSLGATLYELLTLHRPFPGATTPEVLERILAEDPVDVVRLNPAIPADLAAIVHKALEKDVRRRYATAEAMASDLRAFLEDRPVTARRLTRLGRGVRWARRNPVVAGLSAALVLVGTVALVWSLAQNVRLSSTVAELRRLADVRLVQTLTGDYLDLDATDVDRVDELDAWLAEAHALVARRGAHEARLAALRTRGTPPADPEDARGWTFADSTDAWQHDTLVEMLEHLDAFVNEPGGALAAVTSWRERIEDIERRSLVEAADLWRATIEDIADPERSPAYGGLRMEPQQGLVPLGKDPESGLHEFAHLLTGDVPERGDDGTLQLTLETGLVFVLIPGGTYTVGARPPDADHPRGSPHVAPQATSVEGPPEQVELDPFFLSKFEATHGQWLRGVGLERGTGPSRMKEHAPDDMRRLELVVETISWHETTRVLGAMRLCLPTGAQWEAGARGGTSTVYYTGDDPMTLQGHANLRDRTFMMALAGGVDSNTFEDRFDDGSPFTMPSGRYEANPFGLHDVHGNVSEWVRERPVRITESPARPGDGFRAGGDDDYRMARGGSYSTPAVLAHVAGRLRNDVWNTVVGVGVRPARMLDR